MNEVVDINNVIDKAIIKALEYMENENGVAGLLAGPIKDSVREMYGIRDNDQTIQSRIRSMHMREILIEVEPSKPRNDMKRVYALNKNMEFNYVCGPLPYEIGSKEIPIEIRRHHTVALQEVIRQWLLHFPEPSADYPFDQASRYQDDVHKCQNHSLFRDLENHLPEMDYGVWRKWHKYIEDLMKLQKMKEKLLSLIKTGISNCFKDLKLKFILDIEDGINNHECYILDKILYDLVLDLSGRVPGQEAYDNYGRLIADFRVNTAIEDRGTIVWRIKGSDELIMVPKEKREALEKGINNFLNLLEVIEEPHITKIGKEIVKKVKELKKDREMMMKELDDILQYHSFPGECKYLSGF